MVYFPWLKSSVGECKWVCNAEILNECFLLNEVRCNIGRRYRKAYVQHFAKAIYRVGWRADNC